MRTVIIAVAVLCAVVGAWMVLTEKGRTWTTSRFKRKPKPAPAQERIQEQASEPQESTQETPKRGKKRVIWVPKDSGGIPDHLGIVT